MKNSEESKEQLKEDLRNTREELAIQKWGLEKTLGGMKVLVTELVQKGKEVEKFKLAVDNVSDQIIITDSDATVLYINNATEKITGYAQEEVVGKKAGKLWGNLMERSFYENLWKTIKIDKKIFIGEIMNQRKNNQTYTALMSITPILDERGEIEFFVGAEHDITKEKDIDKAKTEFVSLASHQLRTPLGIIKWYLEILQKEDYLQKAPQQTKEYFNEVYKSNERVLALVRDLLSVSRIDQGRVKDAPEPVNILEIITDIVTQMQILAKSKKVTLRLELKAQKLPSMYLDPLRFHEVVENLIANAIEYTPALGKVEVILDTNKDTVTVSIQDTGMGISEEDKSKLFNKFFRSQEAIKNNPEGSGLGLYVVKSYVEQWGGKISVESSEGKPARNATHSVAGGGSKFTISLPISQKKNV